MCNSTCTSFATLPLGTAVLLCYKRNFLKFFVKCVTTLEPLSRRYPWVRLYFVSVQKKNLLTFLANIVYLRLLYLFRDVTCEVRLYLLSKFNY